MKDREKQQRVFGWLAECLSLIDKQVCPLHGRLGFGRGVSFDVDERRYERDLKLDLFAT
jgi:hypothetical protein